MSSSSQFSPVVGYSRDSYRWDPEDALGRTNSQPGSGHGETIRFSVFSCDPSAGRRDERLDLREVMLATLLTFFQGRFGNAPHSRLVCFGWSGSEVVKGVDPRFVYPVICALEKITPEVLGRVLLDHDRMSLCLLPPPAAEKLVSMLLDYRKGSFRRIPLAADGTELYCSENSSAIDTFWNFLPADALVAITLLGRHYRIPIVSMAANCGSTISEILSGAFPRSSLLELDSIEDLELWAKGEGPSALD